MTFNKKSKEMGYSTNYYRTHPEAKKKKAKKDKEIGSRPEQMAKKRERAKRNYWHDKKYGKASRKGKDLAHTKNGLRYKSVKANRGAKGDTKGDRNARG